MSALSSEAAVPTAVWMIGKVSVLLAVAALAHVAMRRRTSAATRHLMWTVAVVGLLLLPVLSTIVPGWQVAIRPSTATALAGMPISGVREMTGAGALEPGGLDPDAGVTINRGDGEPARQQSTLARMSWKTTLLALYATGVLLFLVRLTTERVAVRRLSQDATTVTDPEWTGLLLQCAKRMGIERPVRLLRSRERTMPMTFGTLRPAILIPSVAETWTEDRRRAVLLHELAHVARRDCLTQTMAAFACAVHWAHPGVWFAARRLQDERELACDDLVLAMGAPPREYAGHLLELAYALGGHRAPALVVSMARPRQLEGRMLAVLDAARNRGVPGLRSRVATVAIAAALLIPVAGVQGTVVPAGIDEEIGSSATGASLPTESSEPGVAHPVDHESGAGVSAQERGPGTWEIRPASAAGSIHLRMTERDSSSGWTLPLSELDGLSAAHLEGTGSPVRFSMRRDAGTFTFEGTFRSGVGAGTYTFAPNPAFPGELTKRGLGSPTAAEQYELARHDIGLAFVDELTSQGYQRPPVSELVKAGHHGARLEYLRSMGGLGYRFGQLPTLIRLRDHGVTPDFIHGLAEQGYERISGDELLRVRDHGVTPDYVREMKTSGYPSLSLDQLIEARDHGVQPEFIRELAGLGHAKLSLDAVITARDHGVSAEYVRVLRELGYKVDLAEATRARDHGVSPEFLRELAALGYRDVSLDVMIRARDHGVTPKYVRELKELGYDRLAIDDLIALRDHGVTPDRIRRANARAGTRLPIDMLRALVSGRID